MPSPFRYGRKSEKEIALEKKNKKIGVIYGYDKIRCKIENENLYAYFSDGMSGSHESDITSNRKFELFYYTVDLPQLPILQAHYIKEGLSSLSSNIPLNKIKTYWDLYTTVCYPEYNRDTLQVNKLLGTHISNSDSWIHSYNPRYVNSWKWHYDQLFNSIDKKFLWQPQGTSLDTGVRYLHSKSYLIGKITDYEKNNLLKLLDIQKLPI